MKKTVLAVALLLFFVSTSCLAQENLNSISISPIQGMKAVSSYDSPMTGNFNGLELAYYLNESNNSTDWIQALNVEDISFAVSFLNTHSISLKDVPNSKGVMGNAVGATTRIDLALFSVGNTKVLLSPGLGLMYFTQSFQTNSNLLVGSHMNVNIQIGTGIETKISQSIKLRFSSIFSHASNASTHLPNDGINTMLLQLAIMKSIGFESPGLKNETFGINDKGTVEISVGTGARGFVKSGYFVNSQHQGLWLTDSAERKEGASNLYQTGLTISYARRLNSVFSIKAGTDVVYYSRPFRDDKFLATYEDTFSSYSPFAFSAMVGGDLWLNRFVMSIEYGRYVKSNFRDPDVHDYWTAGTRYFITNAVALNAKVYFHGVKSGYPNFGVLFRIH
jgi:hypothetical protein